ncbi:MAG TPA: Uma2 family endonuclease [Longimicrobium sp.]|nr:Uma2 family endonuclease [Longimicrobium sp.]
MATNPARRGWSYAEYARLPDDGNLYEIIDGEVYVTPAPKWDHQRISMRLSMALGTFVETHDLGELAAAPADVFLTGGSFVQPDLVFIRSDRLSIISERGVEGAPDLVVEIVSPATALRDRGLKREGYAEFGVPLYWVVDADLGHVEVYRLDADPDAPPEIVRDILAWQPVPGGPELRVNLADVFRGFN